VGEELLVLEGQLLPEVVGHMGRSSLELGLRGFVDLRVGTVEAIGTNTVQLETDAGSAGPGVGGCCIALDFPPSTPFTRSHHWVSKSITQHLGNAEERGSAATLRTLQPLVAVVLINEDII
jgi:hypothetical protein